MTLEEEDHVFIMTLDLGGGGEQLIPWNWIHYFSLCPLLSLAIIILIMMLMLMMMIIITIIIMILTMMMIVIIIMLMLVMMMMSGAEMCYNEW